MFTAFTLRISGALDVHGMPVQLAHVIVRMSMKGTHHEAQLEGLYPWGNATGACGLRKGTANVVGTAALRAIHR